MKLNVTTTFDKSKDVINSSAAIDDLQTKNNIYMDPFDVYQLNMQMVNGYVYGWEWIPYVPGMSGMVKLAIGSITTSNSLWWNGTIFAFYNELPGPGGFTVKFAKSYHSSIPFYLGVAWKIDDGFLKLAIYNTDLSKTHTSATTNTYFSGEMLNIEENIASYYEATEL
jgi:hypothetical protein